MDLLEIIILSIVEGITEFLPVSSTGHLVLTSKILNIPQTEFVKTFEIVIQLGAILSVVVLYTKRILSNLDLFKKLIAAFIPTGIIGLTLYREIKDVLLGNSMITVISLLIGGLAIIGLEWHFKRKNEKTTIDTLSYKKALLIGVFQAISVVPGVSRAAATIFGGMFMGLSRKDAVEFSFMLAIPTMVAATGYDLLKSASNFTSDQFVNLGLGLLLSFIFALITVKWLIKFVQTNTFVPFGIYRIILAVLFYSFLI